MSDIMYNDAGAYSKSPWKRGDWKKIAVHNDVSVLGFFGKYDFLSNFYPTPVWFEGMCYLSSENAYQAAKVVDDDRIPFTAMSPAESKKAWRSCRQNYMSPAAWDKVKYDIMARILFEKFTDNTELREKLLLTGDRELSEYNWWKDTYWGYDVNLQQGDNNLGKLLMYIRGFWHWTKQM